MSVDAVALLDCMDRCDAATTLLLWQVEGGESLPTSVEGASGQSLLSIVEQVNRKRPREAAQTPRPVRRDASEWVKLDEEREVKALRESLKMLAPVLKPEEMHDLEGRLRDDIQPARRIATVREAIIHLGARRERLIVQRDFEARFVASPPEGLRALLLFARDGRPLAVEGDASGLDMTALSSLVRRGEAGNAWSLRHPVGLLFGQVGERAALVAVFAGFPRGKVSVALRASIASLEQREKLLYAPQSPENHTALAAYLRAVRALLLREN